MFEVFGVFVDGGSGVVLSLLMRWVPVSVLGEGAGVVGFDASTMDSSARYRLYREGVVSGCVCGCRRVFGVRVSPDGDGGVVLVLLSGGHEVLVRRNHRLVFRAARELRVGDSVVWFASPRYRRFDAGFRLGYVLGAFAGDGSIPGWKDRVVSVSNQSAYVSSIDESVTRAVKRYSDSLGDTGFDVVVRSRAYNASGDVARMPVVRSDGVDALRRLVERSVTASITDTIVPEYGPGFVRGWVSGVYDTDGSFPDGERVVIAQNHGAVHERIKQYVDYLGYEYTVDAGERNEYSPVVRLRPGRETGRLYEFLADISPHVRRKRLGFLDHKRIGGKATVTNIEPLGERHVTGVRTNTSNTMIVNGLLTREPEPEP